MLVVVGRSAHTEQDNIYPRLYYNWRGREGGREGGEGGRERERGRG